MKVMEAKGRLEAAGSLIAGGVHGVGFRRWTLKRAPALHVACKVRTVPDGSVEVAVLGPPGAVKELWEDLARGPRFARADGIVEIPCSLDPATVGVSIL